MGIGVNPTEVLEQFWAGRKKGNTRSERSIVVFM
jgi:hypothetical protein